MSCLVSESVTVLYLCCACGGDCGCGCAVTDWCSQSDVVPESELQVSTDTEGLTTWTQRGPTIPMPKRINTGYRDPVRAFEYNGKWYVGVGCGNKEEVFGLRA